MTRVDLTTGDIIPSSDPSQQKLHSMRLLCQGAMLDPSPFVQWHIARPRSFEEILEVVQHQYKPEGDVVQGWIPDVVTTSTPKQAARLLAERCEAARSADPYGPVRKGTQRAIVYAFVLPPSQYKKHADASAELFEGEVRWLMPEQRRAAYEIIRRVQASPHSETAIAAYADVLPAGHAPDSKILAQGDLHAFQWARDKYMISPKQ